MALNFVPASIFVGSNIKAKLFQKDPASLSLRGGREITQNVPVLSAGGLSNTDLPLSIQEPVELLQVGPR